MYAPRRRWDAALTGAATRSSLGAAKTSLDSSSVRMAPSLHNQRRNCLILGSERAIMPSVLQSTCAVLISSCLKAFTPASMLQLAVYHHVQEVLVWDGMALIGAYRPHLNWACSTSPVLISMATTPMSTAPCGLTASPSTTQTR